MWVVWLLLTYCGLCGVNLVVDDVLRFRTLRRWWWAWRYAYRVYRAYKPRDRDRYYYARLAGARRYGRAARNRLASDYSAGYWWGIRPRHPLLPPPSYVHYRGQHN